MFLDREQTMNIPMVGIMYKKPSLQSCKKNITVFFCLQWIVGDI
jgi:hypothetical protein